MTAPAQPAFHDFFEQVRGFRPLPWQSALASRVVDDGWPPALAIPTGLGKTAAIDIGVWALAGQATRLPRDRTLPTRIWYVVNRRLLVDAAYDHARLLSRSLADAREGPLRAVAERLRSMAAFGTTADDGNRELPLQVSRLRGGAALGARPPEPSQPALLFATVPMFASRWLFRGYGSSDSMRPVDAAHAGIDALVLLDEAHLSRHLLSLGDVLHACDAGDGSAILGAARSRVQIVAMTATGDEEPGQIALTEDDYRNPVVHQRLHARKPTRLVQTTPKKATAELVSSAVTLLRNAEPEHATCVLFLNTATRAAEVAGRAREALPDADVVVVTGRLREPDAAEVRDRLLGHAEQPGVASSRQPQPRARPLLVVATQTLEVGADFDFDFLVTQSAGVRALTQRFGRLNRLGERDHAAAVIVHVPGEDPVYGDEPNLVWERLTGAAEDEHIDLGPAHVGVIGNPADEPQRAGVLLPAHLWEWVKTSAPPVGEAPIEAFFDGFDEQLARVSVCWRAWLPSIDERCVPLPSQDEAVEVPLGDARRLLERISSDAARRISGEGTLQAVDAGGVYPGATIIVHASGGGYGGDGWSPEQEGVVPDLSILHRGALPLHPHVCAHLLTLFGGDDTPATWGAELTRLFAVATDALDDEAARSFTRQELAAEMADTAKAVEAMEGPAEVVTLLRRLAGASQLVEGPEGVWVVVLRRERQAVVDVRLDAFDDLTFDASSIGLEAHNGAVGEAAATLARALGVRDNLVATIAHAGKAHDAGKADSRFQRWLDPDSQAGQLLAKSGRQPSWRLDQARAGWPSGGRHELLSGRAVAAWITAADGTSTGIDHDLLIHLVQSHHGGGRPLVATPSADPLATEVKLEVLGRTVTIDGDLTADDWEQPERFRRLCERYGYWGLALLETIVRQADHAVSAASSRKAVVMG